MALFAATNAVLAKSEKFDLTLPATVSFTVNDATSSTTGSPSPFTVSLVNGSLQNGHKLLVQVKASATNFTPPSGGGTMPASLLSWTVANAVNGSGTNGTLSTSYATVFTSTALAASCSWDMTWSLAAPGTSIHAGSYTLTVNWSFTSF